MNLANTILAVARKNPAKSAVFWGPEEWTYQRVANQVHWVAETLRRDYGLNPGQRVGIWLKNCPEFISALLGILAADGVAVPINNFLKPEEAGYILEDADIDLLFTDETLGQHIDVLQETRSALKVIRVEEIPKDPKSEANLPESTRAEKDLAVVIYTSGTTGRPKGAMLSHGNLLHNVSSCKTVLQAARADRLVVLLPMFHSFMLTVGILLPLVAGGSIVLIRALHPPKTVIQEIIQRKGTILPSVPAFFRTLVKAASPSELPLRVCVSGAAPLPMAVLEEFNKKFSIPLIEGYGLSEASPVVTMNPIDGVKKPGSIGLPLPDVEVSIQDDQGNILSARQTGEVCVRGGNVMIGYLNKPEETAKAKRGGWLLTGDVGHIDEDGYVYITERKKDMLLVNGMNVYPREIEEVIYQFPNVKEAAVIGKSDPRKGDQPIAFITVSEGASLDEKSLIQFLKSKLADYKIPRSIKVVPALPRTATGKILKTELRKLAAK